jgi:hypothetical protein
MDLKSIGLIAMFAVIGSPSTHATAITFAYTANVTNYDTFGDTSFLPNAGAGLVVGQGITGSFSYDTTASSVSNFPNTLDYSGSTLT